MRKTNLGKVFVSTVAVLALLLQGCGAEKPVEWVEADTSVSVSSVSASSVSKEETIETSVSSVSVSEETSVSEEASGEEPVEEPKESDERPEGVFLRLVQSENSNPLVIELYEDGSYICYPNTNPTEKDNGYWNYDNKAICLAAAADTLVVNEFSLTDGGFAYVRDGSSGFPMVNVKNKDFFFDSERNITDEEMKEYQQKLGGAPFHARFPSVYGKMDDIFLGSWKDQSGMFVVNIFKISAEVGGYSFTIKDAWGTELGAGDAHIEGESLVMHQGSGALDGGLSCSAVKNDNGITINLDSAALVNYGIPAGDTYEIFLTR